MRDYEVPQKATVAVVSVEQYEAVASSNKELLEALEDLVYQVDRPSAPGWLSLDEARAAIRSARETHGH